MRAGTWLLLGVAVVALVLGACGGGGRLLLQNSFALSAPSSQVLEGETLRVTASTKEGPLTWSSSDTRTACVDQKGTVIGCTEGRVTIRAQSPSGAVGALAINVKKDADFNDQLPEDGMQFPPVLSREISLPSCEVTLNLSGFGATIRRGNYRPYHRLKFAQAGYLGEVGKPELPFYTLYFAIPVNAQTYEDAAYAVTVEREMPKVVDGVRPWPHQPPRWITGDPKRPDDNPPFTVDDSFYASEQKAWPQDVHETETAQAGNLRLLAVRVMPVIYTPATHRLTLYTRIRVRVTFTTNGELVMPRPVGDYKGIKEVSGDAFITEVAQNSSVISPVGSGELAGPLPEFDPEYKDLPFDMLILTRPGLETPARRLAQWRQDQGTRVWLAVCDPTEYPHPDSLKTLIRTLDDLNRLDTTSGGYRPHAMRAICIFGDVEHIPTWEGLNERARRDPTIGEDPIPIVGTDLPYSTLRGLDWVSDVALGRISVNDDVQGGHVVDKIEAYEGLPAGQRPHGTAMWGYFDDEASERVVIPGSFTFTNGTDTVTGSGFAGQVHVGDVVRPAEGVHTHEGPWDVRVASVDSNTQITLEQDWPHASDTHTGGLQVGFQDGRDDWEFVKAAERVRMFLRGRGVNVHFGYTRRDRPITAPTPTHGFEGLPLHPDLIGYGWNATTAEIRTRWRLGMDGIVLHSDHGHRAGWGDPDFHRNDIDDHDIAGAWYPIVMSINCSSGWFDSETDREVVWVGGVDGSLTRRSMGTGGESFCEGVLRDERGGGVAAIGASRGTDADKNDRFIDGLFGAFYEDYVYGAILMGPGTRYAHEYLGDAVRAAKYTMRTWMLKPFDPSGSGGGYSTSQALYAMQAYHLFGDPMLKIRRPEGPSDEH